MAVLAGALRDRAQGVVDAVAEQSAVDELEVIVVDLEPEREPIVIPDSVRGATARLPGAQISRAKVEAVQRASAPAVAFLEDHCYPLDGWAQVLIDRHREGWAGIGYAFVNANPETWTSRSGMIADYALFADPAPHGPATFLSGNNVSYRRDALLALGDRLHDLVVDFNIQQALLRRGERLFVESRALVAHENFERMSDLGRANYAYCRALAANRARGWSSRRRRFYWMAAPAAAPAIKLARLARSVATRPSLIAPTLSALPLIVTVYGWAAVGEARGYLDDGPETAERDFLQWELAAERAGTR